MRSGTVHLFSVILALSLVGCANAPASIPSPTKPRNVILFLGDGMGVSTVTAARIYAGQQQGGTGEEFVLPFETFPNVALVKTYNTDSQVSDSAGTMSAIMTGEKTRIGVLSVAASVPQSDCPQSLAAALPTLLEDAEDAGLATGIISTARITHATPAATYAHTPNRNWEADVALPAAARQAGCRDIAEQMVHFNHGDGIDVILGGGRAVFYPSTEQDPEYPESHGVRGDATNLIDVWLGGAADRHFVWNRQQLDEVATRSGQILGVFEPSHMRYEADRANDSGGEPSLAEMTRLAIERLRQKDSGYFLMVEGGRIDHAHHDGNAFLALKDTVAFADAVQTAMDLTDEADTLILVTADHSHTLTIGGYPKRGNPILGKVDPAIGADAVDSEGRPYTTLSYANGLGHVSPPTDLTSVDTQDPEYRQIAAVPLDLETHGGEDVAAYARGPNADTLRGVIEQQKLYAVMKGALFGNASTR